MIDRLCTQQTRYLAALLVVLLLLSGLSAGDGQAQETTTPEQSISIAVPQHLESLFEETILPGFMDAYPDTYVELRLWPEGIEQDLQPGAAVNRFEDYMSAVESIAGQADVIVMLPYVLTTATTRAGYLLDIDPLVAGDARLMGDDMPDALLEAFQWDGGQWALPLAATPLVLSYDAAALDAAGVGYPDASTSFEQLMLMAEQLATADTPGLQVTSVDFPAFVRIMAGASFATVDAQPNLTQPELASLLETWQRLEAEGVVSSGFVPDAPLRFARLFELANDDNLNGVLLNGQASTDIYSVALSGGTTDVEAAYELAQYLTRVPEIAQFAPATLPVRYTMRRAAESSLDGDLPALANEALASTVTAADTLFGQYVLASLSQIAQDDSDTGEVLQSMQTTAAAHLAEADAIAEALTLVLEPAAPPESVEGVSLVMGLYTGRGSLDNRSDWEAALADFVESDPVVEQIDLNFVPSTEPSTRVVLDSDCTVGGGTRFVETDVMLPLEPLLAADADFDEANLIGDTLDMLRRNGEVYVLPMVISPLFLYYDKQLFEAADLPLPENDWTIDEFVLALRELESVTEGPPLWFDFNRFTPWEALIVASGAMPLDYSTEPPTFQLTDEDVFPAVKQVFDLSKEGLIAYKEMATFFGFGAREEYDPAIESKLLNFLNLQYELTTHGLVNFPRGTEQVPVMFYVTGSNIHADTEHPEACYRLLQHMTQVSPRLLRGMPAYHDVLETEQTRAAFGDDTVQTFLDFAERVESPQAVYLDSGAVIRGPGMFLGRAFDRYMMNDADLLAELEQAEAYIEDYRACTSADDYAGDVIGCILQVDPSMRDEFEPRNLRGR